MESAQRATVIALLTKRMVLDAKQTMFCQLEDEGRYGNNRRQEEGVGGSIGQLNWLLEDSTTANALTRLILASARARLVIFR